MTRLILTRKAKQGVRVEGPCTITNVGRRAAKLAFESEADVPVVRCELPARAPLGGTVWTPGVDADGKVYVWDLDEANDSIDAGWAYSSPMVCEVPTDNWWTTETALEIARAICERRNATVRRQVSG